jgi:hypothetical protein
MRINRNAIVRLAVVVSAAALGLGTTLPAWAGSGYRTLDDVELLGVVGAVDLLEGSYTHIMLSGPAADPVRTDMGVCDVDLPAGRVAFHLVEDTKSGADQAAAIIDEVSRGGPGAYLKALEKSDCAGDLKPIKAKGVPSAAVTLTDHDESIPFVAVIPRGKVVLLVEAATHDAMVKSTVAAVAAYDEVAGTAKALS